MFKNDRTYSGLAEGLTFALLIFAPLFIVAAGLIFLTVSMLNGISQTVDRQEHVRAWQAAQSSFKAEERRLASLVSDNAHWGEAVQNCYEPINEDWIHGMWGETTGDVNYDTALVVQPDGKIISAYRKGVKVDLTADFIGKERMKKLLADMPADNSTFMVTTSLVMTADGPMVMAAGPIVPNGEEGIAVPTERANFLLLGQHITSSSLTSTGNQYIVDRLRFTSLGDPAYGEGVLTDKWNIPVARIAWTDRHPGQAASEEHQSTAIILILGLLAAVVPISIAHFRTTRQLSRKRKEASYSARHDGLTGLANRSVLLEELEEQLFSSDGGSLALMYIDLDGFKNVNDAYGHEIGDLLLRMVAAGLIELAGDNSIVRLGGDEFAITVVRPDYKNHAERIAHAVMEFVREPFDVRGRSAVIGASIGIAKGEVRMQPIELMRRADIAMYDAKENGRGIWRWFNPRLDDKRGEHLSIATELRTILAKGQIEVAYQPIVDAATRSIKGVEALARWPQSSPRRLSPADFIPVAEEHGLISALGQQVLRKACRDLAKWSHIRLAFNVSPIQLNDRCFLESLLQVAREENFDLNRLEVEFTESVLIRNARRAKAVISALHEHHVSVSLDDFGTGYASVGYLRSFAFDKIKLDRSLTTSVLKDSSAQKVVQGTVLIARALSAEIIAEGVESEEEAQIMRLSGCHELQGFYLGRPQSVEKLETRLNTASDASDGGPSLLLGAG